MGHSRYELMANYFRNCPTTEQNKKPSIFLLNRLHSMAAGQMFKELCWTNTVGPSYNCSNGTFNQSNVLVTIRLMPKSSTVFLTVLVCFAGVFGCRTEPTPPTSLSLDQPNLAGAAEQLGPGLYQRTVARAEGPPLRYTINIPLDFDPAIPLPLIIALHFGGETTPFYGERMITQLCGPAFRPLPAIIVAPDALSDNWTSKENEQVVLSTYDHIVKNYNIDKKKTLLTGFSMGGHGTWYIAGRHQDLFSAAIPIAAQPDQTTSDWTIPVYAIHSRGDKVIPIGPAREYITKMRKNGANMRLMNTRSIPHHRTELYAKPLRDTLPWLKGVWSKSTQP